MIRSIGGKTNEEGGASTRLGAEGQLPAHLLDDLPAHKQAEAGPVGLGREVGLKEPRPVVNRDASAIVLDAEDDVIPFLASFQVNPAPSTCGIDGVEHQIEDDLGQMVANSFD